ncbi:MAG: M20/M25/M40 family metallo-hydrolase [Kofleriaceae bacterium]
MLRHALVILGIGCGGSSAAIDAPESPEPDTDSPPVIDAAVTCAPFATCTWLDELQHRIVGSLAGEREIAPGLTITHRASASEREATRVFLIAELEALGFAPTRHGYTTGANVIATLAATEGSGGTIIVGAHFDGVPQGPGAADNATGVAIVLAAAAYLRDVPVRRHPVVFALFDEEELGLLGSKAYARSVKTAGTTVTGVHVFDMLSFDGDGDHAVELWSPSPALATAYEAGGVTGSMPISSVTFSRSDHQAFLDAGFPAVGVGEEFVGGDHTPDYHMASDSIDKVSFAHLALVTNLAFAVLETTVAE